MRKGAYEEEYEENQLMKEEIERLLADIEPVADEMKYKGTGVLQGSLGFGNHSKSEKSEIKGVYFSFEKSQHFLVVDKTVDQEPTERMIIPAEELNIKILDEDIYNLERRIKRAQRDIDD